MDEISTNHSIQIQLSVMFLIEILIKASVTKILLQNKTIVNRTSRFRLTMIDDDTGKTVYGNSAGWKYLEELLALLSQQVCKDNL